MLSLLREPSSAFSRKAASLVPKKMFLRQLLMKLSPLLHVSNHKDCQLPHHPGTIPPDISMRTWALPQLLNIILTKTWTSCGMLPTQLIFLPQADNKFKSVCLRLLLVSDQWRALQLVRDSSRVVIYPKVQERELHDILTSRRCLVIVFLYDYTSIRCISNVMLDFVRNPVIDLVLERPSRSPVHVLPGR